MLAHSSFTFERVFLLIWLWCPMKQLTTPFVLLDDCSAQADRQQSLLFDAAEHVIVAHSLDEVPNALERIDALVKEGYHVGGWIAYDVAALFEDRLEVILTPKPLEPLIWMIATRNPRKLSGRDVDQLLGEPSPEGMTIVPSDDIPDFVHYNDKIERIHSYIQAGDVYQINYTFDQPFTVEGSSTALYAALRGKQPVHFGALIKTGDLDILSLSPELFIACKGGKLTARPMKGTAPRGQDEKSDEAIADAMLADEKSRAENLMIVDLLRNDLSRIAEAGSVKVPTLFEIEKYQTLLQMTSTIEAALCPSKKPSDILAALFPCGSVTGAPKIRAMEIIAELEDRPRGVYCGAIGYFAPSGDFTLSVPIRTATIRRDCQGNMTKGSMGIGSGIVADSEAFAEYGECALKACFLTELNPDCDLIETFKWTAGDGFLRLDQHLDRLAKSAATFYRPIDLDEIRRKLYHHVKGLTVPLRVRLTLSRSGMAHITSSTVADSSAQQRPTICLAGPRVLSSDLFLRHKTSLRDIFDSVRGEANKKHGVIDVIFLNEEDEVTQGAISNIFVEIDGVLVTPPLESGLLGGIMRQTILDGPRQTQEAKLTEDDLKRASNLYICNSVRDLVPVTLLDVAPVSVV